MLSIFLQASPVGLALHIYAIHFRLVSITIPKNLKLVFTVRRESDYYLTVESDPKESVLGSVWD